MRPKDPNENRKTSNNNLKKNQDESLKDEIELIKKINEELSKPFSEASENEKPYFIFFDLETTGFPPDGVPEKEFENWPFPIQLTWMLFSFEGNLIKEKSNILLQDTEVPEESSNYHGITNEKMKNIGEDPILVYQEFVQDIKSSSMLIAHNMEFDYGILKSDFYRKGLKVSGLSIKKFCTMKKSKDYCSIPLNYKSGFKYPKLTELAACCFAPKLRPGRFKIKSDQNELTDIKITAACFFYLYNIGEFQFNEQ
jgi:DNA polymerase III epsilon subunit-like protein